METSINNNETLDSLTALLQDVRGIDAIVLGGSCCVGMQNPASDIDICVYYNDRFNVSELNNKLALIDDEFQSDIILPPGSWGKWLDSGGVCVIGGIQYDFSLRKTCFVSHVIHDCIHGHIAFMFSSAYPYGYGNYYLFSEAHYCKILFQLMMSCEFKKN